MNKESRIMVKHIRNNAPYSLFMIHNSGKSNGFTLIELLITISIITVLASFSIVTFQGAQKKARDGVRKGDLRNLQTSLRAYYNDKGSFPTNNESFQMMACGAGCDTACSWAAAWNCGAGSGQTYMNRLPKDPVSVDYRYTLGATGDDYTLDACLENAGDVQGIDEIGFGASCTSDKMYRAVP